MPLHHCLVATSNCLRQQYGHFKSGDGTIVGYQGSQRIDSNLQRLKARGVVSHFLSQRAQLVNWLLGCGGGQPLQHAIVVRIFDDTNVWVSPERKTFSEPEEDVPGGVEEHEQRQDDEENEQGQKKGSGKQGKRKVSQLLGIVQKIFARKQDSSVDFARIHTPSQVLPKAGSTWSVKTEDSRRHLHKVTSWIRDLYD